MSDVKMCDKCKKVIEDDDDCVSVTAKQVSDDYDGTTEEDTFDFHKKCWKRFTKDITS